MISLLYEISYMYMYPTSAGVYRICRITYMYMYRAAVHNLDAEFTFLQWRPRMLFSRELNILYHFTHASILPMYLARSTLSLCLRLQFGTRSDRQRELCNYLTFCWYSGSCFEITISEKLSRLKKACKITQHAKASTVLEVSRF